MRRGRITWILAIAASALALGRAAPAQRDDSLPDPAFVSRWASVTAYLIEEFRNDNRSAIANIEGDFSTLEMRVRATSSRDDVWVKRTFTEAELQREDPRTVAKALFGAAKRKAG